MGMENKKPVPRYLAGCCEGCQYAWYAPLSPTENGDAAESVDTF
jgi:hypothetical protein